MQDSLRSLSRIGRCGNPISTLSLPNGTHAVKTFRLPQNRSHLPPKKRNDRRENVEGLPHFGATSEFNTGQMPTHFGCPYIFSMRVRSVSVSDLGFQTGFSVDFQAGAAIFLHDTRTRTTTFRREREFTPARCSIHWIV